MKFNLDQKIYNHGDMANKAGWFTITEKIESMFGKFYTLTEINGDREIKSITEHSIKEVYKGNGSTRLVTEQAYNNYIKESKKLNERLIRGL